MAQTPPAKCDVVIVGGGIIGCSIAYHLPKFGIDDVVLVERKKLTSGTTWHAAGIVGRLRQTKAQSNLAGYGAKLFRAIEEETGQATGYRENGGCFVALNDARLEVIRRAVTTAAYFGVEARMLAPEELSKRWPLLNRDGVLGASWIPGTGQVNPIDATMALAKGARRGGVQNFEDTKVTRLLTRGNAVVGVETEAGDIEARLVVLAAGMWTREIARTIGVNVPLQAAEHFYLVTEPIAGLDPQTPVLVALDERAYYKEDAGKLLFGVFEARGKPWASTGIPESFEFDSLPADYDHYEQEIAWAMNRVPKLAEAGVQTFFVGPESFTPDGRYLIGPTPEKEGLFICAGFNSNGIMAAPSIGHVVAEWIRDGLPRIDMHWALPSRMAAFQANRRYLVDRTAESLGLWANMPWPGRQMETARGARRMPLHHEQRQAGACFGERAGWEIPLWYRHDGEPAEITYRMGRQDWYPALRRESLATRDAVAFYDQSAYGKFLVKGPDAGRALDVISANNVDVEIGRVVYTPWLNRRGGIEADVTVTRLAEDAFLVITGFADQVTDFAWLQRHIPADARLTASDVSNGYVLFGIMGPRSRELLQRLSDRDLSDPALPFAHSAEIDLAYATVRASRVTFVGELGYELLVPTDMCGHVYEAIWEAGGGSGLTMAGLYTMAACRLERGYRIMGVDIGPEETPIEAGLAFAVAWDKAGGFIGRESLLDRRGSGAPATRLVQVCIEDDSDEAPILIGREVIWRNGERVGSITSGGWGFRLEKSLGMGYVTAAHGITSEWLQTGRFEVEVALSRHPARVQLRPFYDPTGARTRV